MSMSDSTPDKEVTSQSETKPKPAKMADYLGMGTLIGIGAGIGLIFGTMMGNLVWGLIIGAALGTVAGAIVEAQRKK
jgi:F0F1-type ATP synthase assembly protein I